MKSAQSVLMAKNLLGTIKNCSSFSHSQLIYELGSRTLKKPPNLDTIKFGQIFTNHMLRIPYDREWKAPEIIPFQNVNLHPAAKVLHYAIELFEGLKAFRGLDDKIRLFRPELNMQRMNDAANSLCLPTFNEIELLKCIESLIKVDQEWVPYVNIPVNQRSGLSFNTNQIKTEMQTVSCRQLSTNLANFEYQMEDDFQGGSLYIRPTLISVDEALGLNNFPEMALLYVILSPVGPYFANLRKGLSLFADPNFTRTWHGSCGDKKIGSNYGSTIRVQKLALEKGHDQVLWLHGTDHQITESGSTNIFLYYVAKNGDKTLATPPLNGIILPGIVRRSILELARNWGEFKVEERVITMGEIMSLVKNKQLLECFGSGTASGICPISYIEYLGRLIEIPTVKQDSPLYLRLGKELEDIQYGRVEHPWARVLL